MKDSNEKRVSDQPDTTTYYTQKAGGQYHTGKSLPFPKPVDCDICGESELEEFVDGVTIRGPWANMCQTCFQKWGRGLGVGTGQYYVLTKEE